MSASKAGRSLFPLALTAALLPLLTIHTCYLISAIEGHISWCMPYAEACTSISRAGRHGTAYFIFKGAMLPALVLLALFWLLNRDWLRLLGDDRSVLMPWLGLIASAALLVYTLSLGHAGDGFFLLRRIGVIGYLGLTFICQLQLGAGLQRIPAQRARGNRLVRLSMVTLGIALFSLAITAVSPSLGNRLEDAFEWWLVLLLNLHALAVAWYWRQTGFCFSTGLATAMRPKNSQGTSE